MTGATFAKMVWLVALVSSVMLPTQALASRTVQFCDGCSPIEVRNLARGTGVQFPGERLVGDRTNGLLFRFMLEREPAHNGTYDYFLMPLAVPESQAVEFMAYSDAWNESPGNLLIGVQAQVTEISSGGFFGATSGLPASAFDITRDGANRTAVRNFLADTSKWTSQWDARLFYAKLIYSDARSFLTGSDFTIRVEAIFPDQSTAIFDYDSSQQGLVFVEARDSAGNLIATNSDLPVQVDYTSYERPEAINRADYGRGLDFLRGHNIIVIGAAGSITVKTPTVIIGDVVTVPR